jgi:hypothetical protein
MPVCRVSAQGLSEVEIFSILSGVPFRPHKSGLMHPLNKQARARAIIFFILISEQLIRQKSSALRTWSF